ncbi:MAG: hypothetical protein DRP10_01100 [Candidatus Aenigmatarchaeota archaeon]|nr:MAG: hypothetical protein DRP10_01100 [Candidatus Aenigmarchaeota archaeon]
MVDYNIDNIDSHPLEPHPPGRLDRSLASGSVYTEKEFYHDKELLEAKLLPGTNAARIYNKFVETADKYFGVLGISLVKKIRRPFELLDRWEYKKYI